jgi:hypothetical protein
MQPACQPEKSGLGQAASDSHAAGKQKAKSPVKSPFMQW